MGFKVQLEIESHFPCGSVMLVQKILVIIGELSKLESFPSSRISTARAPNESRIKDTGAEEAHAV
jgi:hypothetical protein